MGKIDTSGWKEFRVGELFAAERGKVKNIQPLCPGETPIIAAGAYNQGIAGTYEIDSAYENRITISCNGAGCGSTFYHPYKFNVNGDAITLIEKNSMSDKAKSFIACILNGAFTRKYSYEEKCSPQKALDEIVRLPPTHNGDPDWAYMESYMANIETRVAESMTLLLAAKDAEKKKVDTREWGEFRVGELFEKLNLRFLPNRVFDKASDISEVKSEEFNLPLVNAKHSNNGIMYYGRKHEWEYEVLTIDIVADGAASTGDVYAQPQETGVLYNAYLVKAKAKCVTGLILFFLSTVIQRCVKDHFGYDNKCTWDKVKHETILLPVDKTGQPDWGYMEEYMRKVEEKTENTLNQFMLV